MLASHGERWTGMWLRRRAEDAGAEFRWYTAEGLPLNQHLLPVLRAMTDDHCAYCDRHDLDQRVGNRESIDHFQPVSKFPELALVWTNLFPSCSGCQGTDGKGSDWVPEVLKPDDPAYSFERYFLYEYGTGEIRANPGAPLKDQERARATIQFLGLNKGGLPTARRRAVRLFADRDDEVRPYRFAFSPA